MAERMTHRTGSLFAFGPLAAEYDRWYDTPAGRAHDRVQKADVRQFLDPVSDGETLLDVGCGTGHWSAFFAKLGYKVTGVDVDPAMIEVARSKVPDCTLQVVDAHNLPFDDGAFDVVTAMAALEFLPDQSAAIGEMVRCCRKGGRILIGTLNRLAMLNKRRLSQAKPPYSSAHLLSPDELWSLLAPLGRVRMVASSPSQDDTRPTQPGHVVERITGRQSELGGPFIVAEVRL